MRVEAVDIDLENLHLGPRECLSTVFWELGEVGDEVDPLFHKEEWFSSTLLEWGRCGKLLTRDGEVLGFTQYAPPTLFPKLDDFTAGKVSEDAAYLSYCYIVDGHRERGLGGELVRAVGRDVVDRGYHALEAIADRDWDGGWVLPERFLKRCGFDVKREDPRFPLMRLDLRSRPVRQEAARAVAVPLPAFEGA
jgi:hypothetical protein